MSNNYGLPEEITARTLFDKAKAHLLSQRAKAGTLRRDVQPWTGEYWACEYRTREGLACAVGCLMPDDVAPVGSHKGGISRILSNAWGAHGPMIDWIMAVRDHAELLSRLQQIHDLQDPDGWAHALRELERETFGEDHD